jgi:hypothetical protein
VSPGDIRVHAEAARAGAGVVLLPDVGEIDVPKLVLMIERDQQASVPDRDIARHCYIFGRSASSLEIEP